MTYAFPGKQNFFLFLELLDPVINDLLYKLRSVFTEGSLSSNVHVTIRGPYKKIITPEKIINFERVLNYEPILIYGIDMFKNPDEYVVYIKVTGERLTEVCWKPDFPKKTYGCNPHISLYRGTDKVLAEKILDFLKKENLKLICKNYRLKPYTSKQSELFPSESVSIEPFLFQPSNDCQVTPGIVKRATELVHIHRCDQVSVC